MRGMMTRWAVLVVVAVLVGGAMPGGASASHSWQGFHWARKANPVRLQIIDSQSSAAWSSRLAAVNGDWNRSAVLENSIVAGSSDSALRKSCPAVNGKIRVCNSGYGATGWLGLASIHTVGTHIVDGTVKMNTYYFKMDAYKSSAERRHVLCQEVGHLFGLGHNRTAVTCMNDVQGTNDPAYQSPNQHDYDMLQTIYSHTDSTTSVASAASAETASKAKRGPDPVGKPRKGGGSSEFVTDVGPNEQIVTFVLWADSDRVAEDASGGKAKKTGAAKRDTSPAQATEPSGEEVVGADAIVETQTPVEPAGAATDVAVEATQTPEDPDQAADSPSTASVPRAPSDVTADVQGNRVDLRWTDTANDETGYSVERSADGGDTWTTIAELDPGSTRARDRDVEPGVYLYRVVAVNEAGPSPSEPVRARVR